MSVKYVRVKGIYLGDVFINPNYITHVTVSSEDPAHPASGIHVLGERLPVIVKGNPKEVVEGIEKQAGCEVQP